MTITSPLQLLYSLLRLEGQAAPDQLIMLPSRCRTAPKFQISGDIVHYQPVVDSDGPVSAIAEANERDCNLSVVNVPSVFCWNFLHVIDYKDLNGTLLSDKSKPQLLL